MQGMEVQTLAEFLAVPDTLQQLEQPILSAALADKCSRAEIEDLKSSLVAEYIAIRWHTYTDTYDASKGIPFRSWVFAKWHLVVRRQYPRARTGKVTSILDNASDGYDTYTLAAPEQETHHELARPEEVHKALAKLTSRESWIVWNVTQGHTYSAIAKTLGIGRGTVKETYDRALDKLARLLADTYKDYKDSDRQG